MSRHTLADPNQIIAAINTVTTGSHHARLHELSPADAKRIRDADEQMAATLAELGTDAADAGEIRARDPRLGS